MSHPFQRHLQFSEALIPLHETIERLTGQEFPMVELVSANGLVNALLAFRDSGGDVGRLFAGMAPMVPVWGLHDEDDASRVWIVWATDTAEGEQFELWEHGEQNDKRLGRVGA